MNPFDLESRIHDNANDSLKIWLRLKACETLIMDYLRGNLRKNFNMTPARHEFLAQLQQQELTMSEIATRLMVSNGNATAVAQSLEQDGLIERRPCEDRRFTCVRLTHKGQTLLATMLQQHDEWLACLFEGISLDDQQQLADVLQRFKTNIHQVIAKKPPQ